MHHSVGTARMSASHTSEKTSHSPGGNESHTSGRAEDHTLGNCDSHIHVSMISEELISRDGSSGEATTSSGELLSSMINGKRSLSTSEKREASILTAEKHHETPTTITTTATACATTTTTTTTTMVTLTTSDTSTRTQEATVSPLTTTPPPDCTDRHGGMWPMESVSEGQTQGKREEGPSPSCSQIFPDAVDLDVPQCSPDVVVLSVQEPQFLPEKIVLLIDRQDAYLRSFSFSNVHQIYDPKLNFGNAFDLITKTLPAFQKNTLFVMLCGTMSALRQVINEKCFLFQCKEPLYNYTLQEFKAPSLDEFLISEAKNLRKNIIEMNNCDVIFTGVLPVRINCAERYEAAKHYTQTGHQVKLACSRHDALYAQLCSGLREFNRWAKTDAASKGFPHWSLVDMLTTSDAVDSSQHFTHPTQADGVTLTGECMVQRRVAIRTRVRETFLRSRKTSQSLKLPQATADEEVKVVAVVPRQCNYKPEAFMQPRETELDEVVLLADQMYRTNLTPLARKRICLITEVKLSPERIAKVVQSYYSKVPKDKKITWILCLGIYNFVEREHNRVCLTRQCKKKLIGIIDEDSKGSLYQKIHSALSTIKNFKSALEKALPKKATLVVAPPLPSALLGTDTFKGNHTQSHIIAMRYRLYLCSPLTYCFIRRFYMQMFDLWVNTVMKLEGGTCAELMSSYITRYKDKSLRLVDASHSNNYVKKCGKEWNNMMRNVISSTLTPTSFVTGLSGLQRSVYLSRLSNVILLESSQNIGQTLTYSLQDKPYKTDYSFKQVIVVGNQMPAELDELCHRLSIHVVPHRVTFDEAGKTLITKYVKLWPHNTLWVILTDVLHLIAAKPLPACEAVNCKDPIPVFGIEMPSNKNATKWQSYINVKVDVFISKVKTFFDSLIHKLGEESAVFLPPVTPVFLMRPDLQESHQTLHAMYDSFGKIAMVNGKPKKWRSSYSLLKKAWLKMLEPYLEHYSVPKRILQLYSTSDSNQDWIKTLGKLLVHFATTTNIGECDAVFSDAEFSSGEEDIMEVTEAMVATAAAAAAAASSSSSSVTLASVPTCSFQAMSAPPAQTQAAAGQGMQHEPERTPRQQQQNKGAVMWSGAKKQWHVVKEKEQLPHKTKRDHTTPMIEERQEKKTGEDEDLQGNKEGQKTPRKEKAQVPPTVEKRQWHDETDRSLQPPRKKICQETAKPEEGQQPPRIEKGQEVCRKKKGKASAKQGKVQETAKQGRNMKASRGRKHVRASRQKEGQQSSKQGQETSKQRICQETSEPGKNKKEEGHEILIQGKCHDITKTEKDKETPMDGKNRETSTGGNYQVNIKKVHKSPIPIKDQVTIKTEKCPEIRGLEESEQLQMTKKDQVTVKMEEDQSIVKMEQFQDVIKSEEFEDMGRSEEVLWSVRKVEEGGGDRQLSNLEKDAWIILSQTDEDKNIGFPERDHLSNYLEDTAAASGTLAQSQTHIPKTEDSLTEPGNSSTALTWVPKSEELESSHYEDDASDTLARDGLWEDMDASVLERNMKESCCKQDVDESGPKEDLEESGSKQNIEQRIPRKDLDGSELTEKRLKEDLNESGPKQNTEQHGPNYDVRESNTKQDTENSDLKPSVEQSIPKQDIEQTSPKQSTEESYPKEHEEKQNHKTNMDENVPSQGDHLSDFEVASNPDSIETVPLDVDSVEQEYIFNLSDDSDIFECEPEGGAGGEDLDIQITKEVVVGTPLRGSKTEGDVEVTCLPNRKRKLSSSGKDSPAPSCSSYNSSFDSDQEMKKLFLMLEESINQTYQVNLQTFMQVPEVHPDYEDKHAEFLKSYKKQHEGKEYDEEHHERSWGEFWEDTVGKQLHEDWEKSKKELVEQFRVIESSSKNSSSSNSTREDQPKQVKRDESDKENQKFQSYSSNPQPLLSVCHKKSESSPLSVNRSPKTNPKHSSDFESCETDMMQFKQLLSEINTGTMSSELKRQALQLDMDKVMTSDTKKRVHLILSSFALLSELGRSLGSLAPALVPIIKAVLDKEVDSEEALNILAKKDNVEVLKKCTEKLMLLSEKARGAYKNKLLRCVKDTIELLENVTTSLKTIKVVWGLDIPSIAKATAHQDMTHVLQFIRNTLASKGVHNPSRSLLNELFLSVSSQHFNLAIQTQPPTSPDTSK